MVITLNVTLLIVLAAHIENKEMKGIKGRVSKSIQFLKPGNWLHIEPAMHRRLYIRPL